LFLKDSFTNHSTISQTIFWKKRKCNVTLPIEPLFLIPQFKETIWGGQRLKNRFGKLLPTDCLIGESWEISAVAHSETAVASGFFQGQNLSTIFNKAPFELVGAPADIYPYFPLLIKFIDANDRLSIQVHPDDRNARERYGEPFGKTECWYVVDAGKKGSLGIGFKHALSRSELRDALETGSIEQLLNCVNVRTGEVYFIPAGTVHAIMGDLLIYEVQQSSNTTLRLYDWKRTNASGQSRKLHIDEAVEVADLSCRENYRIEPLEITSSEYLHRVRIACRYFTLEEYYCTKSTSIPLAARNTFQVVTILDGDCNLTWNSKFKNVEKGATILIPAILKDCAIQCMNECRFLTTSIPDLDHDVVAPLVRAGFSVKQITAIKGEV
jgi:mannose-6-phosphate isomerase